MDISSLLQSIEPAQLEAIVRQSLQCDAFQIQDWKVSQLGGGAGNPVSVGLYRFEGTGKEGDESLAWSVILKILQSPANVGIVDMGEGENQAHWNYWKRELYVYQLGLLEMLPDGMVSPRCFDTVEQPGNTAWLWLEDITDSCAGAWSLERYALTARHLGRLNGTFGTSRPLPTNPWVGANLTQQWGASFQPYWQSLPWEHHRVLERYRRANSFQRLLQEYERFQARLNLLPRTICHGDTYPTNFMSRKLADGREQTVALDWALVNIGPIGDDLGQFVFGAWTNLKEVRREDITQALFDSYIQGLQDSGCYIEPKQVRFGFTASAALRIGLFQIYLLSEELKRDSEPAREVVEHSITPNCFEVAMADEAYELLESV
jgi:hypothetical protein